jgi:signal transduction histidine kinase
MGAGPIAKVSGAASELFDIREPVKIPTIWSWLGPALVAVAAALAAFLIWRRLRRRDAIVEARETAADRARLRLREAWNYLERPERFCTLLSEIVRVYLEERFRLRAPEQTTEEFLAYTQQNNVLNQRHRELLGRFLEQCDLVKFAAHEPARKDLEQLHDAASNFVEETGYELPALTEALGQEVVAR